MDKIRAFIEAIQANMPDGESKDAFIGFAHDAESDSNKEAALCLWIEDYQNSDGTFDEAMYTHEGYELFDFYEDYMATK